MRRRLTRTTLVAACLIVSSCSGHGDEPRSGVPVATEQSDTRDLVSRCLKDRGYQVSDAPGGLLKIDSIGGQTAAQQQSDVTDCSEQFASAEQVVADDEEAARRKYDELVAVAECMDSHGYASGEVPPSFERFVATGAEWSPYGAFLADQNNGDRLGRLITECPMPGLVQVTIQG